MLPWRCVKQRPLNLYNHQYKYMLVNIYMVIDIYILGICTLFVANITHSWLTTDVQEIIESTQQYFTYKILDFSFKAMLNFLNGGKL